MTIEALLEEVRTLSEADQHRLLQELTWIRNGLILASEEPTHSILEFAGVGAEMWNGIDAQDYVDQMRDEWDEK